jgi:hypothetical protein
VASILAEFAGFGQNEGFVASILVRNRERRDRVNLARFSTRRDGRVVDGGGLENVGNRLYQDGYIFGAAITLECAESRQNSCNLAFFDTKPYNRSILPSEM